jgi:hypothetical protein
VARTPLTQGEREWLLRTLEEIVRRAGTAAAGIEPTNKLTLQSMPLPAA